MLTVQVLRRRGAIPRAALSTVEIMTLLVAAHTWAGGTLPATGWIAATAALVFGAGAVVLRGRAPMRVVVPALAVTQLLLHCWMVVLGPTTHGHVAHLDLTWQMVLAHLAGAVATAAIWALRRRAVDVVLAWSEAGLVPVPGVLRTPARYAPVIPLRRPLVVVPLRGPPVGRGTAA